MPSRRALPSQAEITRYAKAMRAAGCDNFRIELDGSMVRLIAGKPPSNDDNGLGKDEPKNLDEAIEQWGGDET